MVLFLFGKYNSISSKKENVFHRLYDEIVIRYSK